MQIHVLEYLERSSALYPDKIVYQDEHTALTFSQVKQRAKKIGSFLCSRTAKNQPIVILSEKSVETPLLYLGVLYSGCFYVPIGTDLPKFRMNLILQTVQADIILTDSKMSRRQRRWVFRDRFIRWKNVKASRCGKIFCKKEWTRPWIPIRCM